MPMYRIKPVTVEAIRFILGVTTKGDILKFCPRANVGVKVESPEEYAAENDSTDIRWIEIDGTTVDDGEWLIKTSEGLYVPCPNDIFVESYDPAEEGHNDRAEVYLDKANEWRYTVVAGNGFVIGAAEEGFSSKSNALRALKRRHPHIGYITERTQA
jgi:uncharacterized protein YegP (UPF0339 family)